MLLDSIVNMTITTMLKMIGIAVGVLVGTILMLSIIDKLFKFFTFKFSPLRVQKGELIRKKMFKCSDIYELKWNGEIKENGSHIIIYIHDFVGDKSDANNMIEYFKNKNNNISVVSYDQRWNGDNEIQKDRNYGANISDLKEIISDLREKYPKQKIILVGHGFGAGLAIYCANEDGVDKVFASSIKIKKGYKSSLATKSTVFWSWLFSSKSLIDYPFDAADLSDDIEFVKHLQKVRESSSSLTVREMYQTSFLLKKAIKKYNKKNVVKNKLIFLQPDKSVYSEPAKFVKFISKISEPEIETLKQTKHHLFNTTSKDAFEIILNKLD